MENLFIEATNYTPEVNFDVKNHILEFKGKSYPENSALFVKPIFSWLEKYLEQLGEQTFTVNIAITYFNTSFSKMLLDLLAILDEEVKDNGKNIILNWFYQEGDSSSKEFGEEFQEDLEALTFNLIEN